MAMGRGGAPWEETLQDSGCGRARESTLLGLTVHDHLGTAGVPLPPTSSSFSLPPSAALGKYRFQERQIWDWKPNPLVVLSFKHENPNLKVPVFQTLGCSQVLSLLPSFMIL